MNSVDDGHASVSFKGPGYEVTFFIDRQTGVTETKMSAVFMTFVSGTGIVLILFLHKRRFSGLMAGAAGAVLCYVVYAIWVH